MFKDFSRGQGAVVKIDLIVDGGIITQSGPAGQDFAEYRAVDFQRGDAVKSSGLFAVHIKRVKPVVPGERQMMPFILAPGAGVVIR